jgi:peptidoglycan hydrolase-like protein with peptidoglycan-binding domain
MTNQETIQQLIQNETLEEHLKQDSGNKESVRALQNLLHELGFDDELNWQKYGADGFYGGSTVNAIRAFAEKNGLDSDGLFVDSQVAKKLLDRFDIVDDLRHLDNAIDNNKVADLFYQGTSADIAVVALQTLLKELGFGQELGWEQCGADGDYSKGTVQAVKAFAEQESIESDGTRLSDELAQKLLDKFTGFYGKDWDNDGGTAIETVATTISGNLAVQEVVEKKRTRLYVSDGNTKLKLTRFKKGAYFFGQKKPADFISSNKETLGQLQGLTPSAINVMIAVAENEGNMDAINTWDNSFMTFGMFQWTLGARQDPGELPAFVKKVKEQKPELFSKYYGQYGLDVIDTNDIAGYFTLNGKKLMTSADKEILRTPEWAFIFGLSGHDPEIRSIEVQHALSRISTFYRSKSYRPKGYYIADLISSEYGIGLLLDNHVNRPGYIKKCLEQALEETGLTDPENWTTDEERTLIDAYLKIRESFGRSPMTDAAKRAAVTKNYLDQGVISDERASFEFGEQNV